MVEKLKHKLNLMFSFSAAFPIFKQTKLQAMKYNVQNLAFLSAVITFASCQEHKQSTIDEHGSEVIKIRKPTEDTVSQTDNVSASSPSKDPEKVDAGQTEQIATPVKPGAKSQTQTTKPGTAAETVKPAKALTVKGVVKDINRGKDGYTAKIETIDGKIIAATVSRANLYDPKQYRDTAVGDVIKVTGNTWLLEGVNQMTVRVLE